MRRSIASFLCFLFLYLPAVNAQTAIQTSFETADGYTAGNLNTQNGWSVSTGAATVYSSKSHTGTQSINFTAANTALLVNKVCYSGSVPGITGDVYADFWVNPGSVVTKSFAVNGYDLYGGSAKRIFVIEFTIDNKIRAFNGSSSSTTIIGTWTANQWSRISVKVDFAAEKYKVALNTIVYGTDLNFRETYTPTASGTRQANIKEFHSLRFNHVTDVDLSTTDVAVDDVYVGTTPIADVLFGGSSNTRTITVTQPAFGSIALNPASGPYTLTQSVTATLTIPQGYKNNGWTGDLSGTSLVQNFTVTGNMAFGADVGIDAANPPPKYKITVNAPPNGTITLSPQTADSMYYKETPVTATVTNEACYLFNGWTGSLSGTQTSNSFTVQNAMTIGADIIINSTPSIKRIVSTVTEFKNALAAMNPGDTVEVNNGTYNLSSLTITRSGCDLKPILIYAKNPGQVILNGATAFVIRSVKNITVSGFVFQSANIGTGIKMENCNQIRITGNTFNYIENASCTWVYIGDTFGSTEPLRSGYNRVDHNIFDGKTQTGNYIRMDGNIDQQSRYDTIDHNWFKNNGPRAVNEKECIRVGVSTLSQSRGYTTIEYNLFTDCDGDPEIISVKSWNNTVRYNTFVRSLGTLSLRQGNESVVEGNYFFGEGKIVGTDGCGGIRVYGKDHKIINNYFSGLTGYKWDAAITITNGDVNNSSTDYSAHFQPENIVVAFNTLVNNYSDIEIGFDNNGNYPKPPLNCQINNNIVVDNSNPIIKSYSAASLAGVSFNNNIMYPTGTSSIGITSTAAQINQTDPLLMQPVCDTPVVNCDQTYAHKVYRLAANSPAIDAANGTYPYALYDFEKQARGGLKDIGADEYNANNNIFISALDSTMVGPNAIGFNYSYTYIGTLPVKLVDFTARYENKKTDLYWQTAEEINVNRYEVEWNNNGQPFTMIAKVNAKGNGGYQNYQAQHTTVMAGKNYYRLKIIDNDGRFTYSPVRMISTSDKNGIIIYPNPARAVINVSISGTIATGTEMQLINSMGMKVRTFKNIFAGQQLLNIQNIPAGIYQLQLTEPGQPARWFAVTVER
ncbi:MAG: chondroitinase-B domain-containing protein [Ferruginibacter sp.]